MEDILELTEGAVSVLKLSYFIFFELVGIGMFAVLFAQAKTIDKLTDRLTKGDKDGTG